MRSFNTAMQQLTRFQSRARRTVSLPWLRLFAADLLEYVFILQFQKRVQIWENNPLTSLMININILPIMLKFYGSANSILCHSKYVPELTKLSLFESFALPVLMYGLDVLFLDPVQKGS